MMGEGGLLLCVLCLIPGVLLTCPSQCSCTGETVDCNGRELSIETLPIQFPLSTREIFLDNNQLASIPNGYFDSLKQVSGVFLSNNPWVCDCDILYLRSWLQKHQNRHLYKDVVCSSPNSMRGRVIMYLTEDEVLSTCQFWHCNVALVFQICLFIFISIQAILLIFIIVFLRRFEKLSKEANRTAKEIVQENDYVKILDDYQNSE
ncbi:platelet glycoprotein Ib beta chain [Latimeria chalumnae]|uniref:Glycoprotein Ib platelet subunit beta n=1 Tax=Latimeria chalumnae TaxID=7897 RepID=M3XJ51_LATCH|nr:PREDICTED: platelet glycoprotein Ib beta chain [Latimeria chalumnae]|eukprot:XP_005990257.1 PREDICTED: platelet glycoprotein Ib beta chain [Latimeria chalumnae]